VNLLPTKVARMFCGCPTAARLSTVYLLRELVQTTTIQSDYATTFKSLVSKLRESSIDVEMEDEARGLVVARCLSRVLNWIFWRARSDKLVFELREIDPAETEVKVYAIPNLWRYRLPKNERTLDWADLKKLVRGLLA
jgi:hypothetical protein